PLHWALEYNRKDVMKYLIEKGAAVNESNREGERPIHFASDVEIAKLLISKGADIHKADLAGNTPLLSVLKLSPKKGATGVAELLIEKGADIHKKDNEGHAPVELAILYNMNSVLALLESKGVAVTKLAEKAMEQAIKNGLQRKSLDINCNDPNHAKWDVSTEVLRDWIEKGLLNGIRDLYISNCNIKSLPDNMRKLTTLKKLGIVKSNLEDITHVNQLRELDFLKLNNNKIESIPNSIGDLSQLRVLSLYENKIHSIPPALIKLFRKNMVDMNLAGNNIKQEDAIYSSNPESISEMERHLAPENPVYNRNFEAVLCDPRSDLSVFLKTPGKEVDTIFKQLLIHNAADLMKEQKIGEDSFKPATKLLAEKLVDKLKNRQNLEYLRNKNTGIGRALEEETLPERSQKNIKKIDSLLGDLSLAEKKIYRHILGMPFYLKHYTQSDRYENMRNSDSKLKSFKTLALEMPNEMYKGSTPPGDRVLGNNGNVFFRLETSPELTSKSRFGNSVITMDENLLYDKGWVYFWDLVMSAGERTPVYRHKGKIVRTVEVKMGEDEDLNISSVKDHDITFNYPNQPTGANKFEFSIADTFFYGKDIKPGLAKFLVYEVRKMGMTEDLVADPALLKDLYRKLYSVQAMIPGEVRLNPTNHRFIEEGKSKVQKESISD
ncbi:MAG: ankyrin repeat domain-containing protein, partial [Bdellovibrionia bacterium]